MQTMVRIYDETGATGRARVFTDGEWAEQYACEMLGCETSFGTTICMARMFTQDDNGTWVLDSEMEY